jgi:hypothetical protein
MPTFGSLSGSAPSLGMRRNFGGLGPPSLRALRFNPDAPLPAAPLEKPLGPRVRGDERVCGAVKPLRSLRFSRVWNLEQARRRAFAPSRVAAASIGKVVSWLWLCWWWCVMMSKASSKGGPLPTRNTSQSNAAD